MANASQKSLKFSQELSTWLYNDKPKTLGELNKVFGERTFAIGFVLLLSLSALPLPTGGITNLLEIIAMILSVQLIVGRKTVWVPRRLENKRLNKKIEQKAIPFIIRRVEWVEKYSRPRMHNLLTSQFFKSLCGLLILGFTITAFITPPFSGLDTLPSLGVVIISLSLIFEDLLLFVVGFAIGLIGVGLVVAISLLGIEFLTTIT